MITELRPSLISFCTSLIARYHQLENLLIEAGAMEFNPNLWKVLYHTCLAKAELTLLLDHKVGKQPDEEVGKMSVCPTTVVHCKLNELAVRSP
jgi:hypothetical protein